MCENGARTMVKAPSNLGHSSPSPSTLSTPSSLSAPSSGCNTTTQAHPPTSPSPPHPPRSVSVATHRCRRSMRRDTCQGSLAPPSPPWSPSEGYGVNRPAALHRPRLDHALLHRCPQGVQPFGHKVPWSRARMSSSTIISYIRWTIPCPTMRTLWLLL